MILPPPVRPAPAAEPARQATRATGRIVMDGKLDESDWARARVSDRFFENTPSDRGPPPERTEVRYLYDDRFLYIGVRAFTDGTGRPRQPFARRDRVDDTMDYIQVYIDPLGRGRSAYFFRTNPRGVKTDGVRDESSASETLAPDFDWDVATAVQANSWTAEFVIPLSTLRIAHAGRQDWIMVAYRGLNRQQDHQFVDYAIPRTASCLMCYVGRVRLDDINPSSERLLITPSIVPGLQADHGSIGHGSPRLHVGLDAKWLPYQGGAVDLTIKPDFSDVDPDDLQLTANARFAIDLPEKRPFFLEGSDLIGTPIPVLYTRNVTQPTIGGRFTHRSETLNVTSFVAGDDGHGAIIQPGLLGSSLGYAPLDAKVGYARAQLGWGAASAGVILAEKRNDDGSFNRLESVDGSWTRGAERVTAQLAVSQTRDPDLPTFLPDWRGQRSDGVAALAQWNHAGDFAWRLRQSYYSPGFRAWLGYVPRVGYSESYVALERYFYFEHGPISSVAPYLDIDRVVGLHGRGHESDLSPGFEASGIGSTAFDFSVHPRATVLVADRTARPQRYIDMAVSGSPTGWLPSFKLAFQAGRLVDFGALEPGKAWSLTAKGTLRPTDRVQLHAAYGTTHIAAAPDGGRSLRETVRQVTMTYYFSARLYALAEYQDDRSRRFYPLPSPDRSHEEEARLVWDASRNLAVSAGIRRAPQVDAAGSPAKTDTRLFIKIAPTIRLFPSRVGR